MPQQGEMVRYGQAGVCLVKGIEEKELAGEARRYYVLTPLHSENSFLYVPCENEELVRRMLPLLTGEEIRSVLEKAAEQPVEWNRNFRMRSESFKRALSSADRVDPLLLIKNVCAHKASCGLEGKSVHNSDDYFLKDAERIVYGEFSVVWRLSLSETETRVRAALGI